MKYVNFAVATLSWARNKEEEDRLRASLAQLATHSLPVFITDGGSSEAFIQFLHSLPGFTVFSAKGLWAQAKQSIFAAADYGAQTILYTEPDKQEFFQTNLALLLNKTKSAQDDGILLASRSAKGFATFPAFQQMTENCINHCCSETIGVETDYCYGPFLFNSQLVSALHVLPEDCGWGWRPFLFATAQKMGWKVDSYSGDFACPEEQRKDDAQERVYRMKQLTQNINGLLLAASMPLANSSLKIR